MRATAEGVGQLGRMYAGNIVGAILGCVLAGFYLLRLYDMPMATYFAAAVNVALALASAAMALVVHYAPPKRDGESDSRAPAAPVPHPWRVYLTIALSGLTALAAEVIWTRLLSLLLGASVYTFSIILAVFLLGLGLGSAAASWLGRRIENAAAALGACQFLLVLAIGWAAFMVDAVLPFWPIDRALAPSPWVNYQIDVLRCACAILPATILWGASFPLAMAAASSRHKDAGRIVGAVYAANTVGSIIGALGTSLILIPWFGTHLAQQFLIALSVGSGLLVSAPYLWQKPRPADPAAARNSAAGRVFGVAGIVAIAGLLIYLVPPPVPQLIAYGRDLLKFKNFPNVLYLGEGVTSSVAVTEFDRKIRYFHVAGKVEASTLPEDLRQERMLGHLSALLHPNPRSVLVVGFGAGITAGSFLLYPGIQRIVICEIEPLIPQRVGPLFTQANYDVLHDPRVQIVYDDARHYMLTGTEKFDVITSDPIHPWVRGSANLYTQQYFELAKKRLNPGGVITQWIPLYESTRTTIKSELATFFKALPDGAVWANNLAGKAYDLVASGFRDRTTVNLDEIAARLNQPEYAGVLASLREVHFNSVLDLFGTYSAQHADLKLWLADAQLNTDTNLRLQYLAGFEYNFGAYTPLSEEIRNFRWSPPTFFVGSSEQRRALFKAISESQ
jgi:spermidine synthase